jgi:hypothetical protein
MRKLRVIRNITIAIALPIAAMPGSQRREIIITAIASSTTPMATDAP